ncbi:glycine-rich domain-containing protein [Algoriphagus antarcticus]
MFAVAEVEVVIVGGGGGAGRGRAAGGGGGGQVKIETITLNLGASLVITIGQGGKGAQQSGNNTDNGLTGENTVVSLNSGSFSQAYTSSGGQGGSGSGNGGSNGNGNAGGLVNGPGQNAKGGGGGGAVGPGTNGSGNGSSSTGGQGGNGVFIASTGNSYGAGGGGNGRNGGSGGSGDGGNSNPSGPGENAASNSGSGGGAGSSSTSGGNGSNGKVIVQIVYRILPVEFLYFNAKYSESNRTGELSWITAKEWENAHFNIERSVNTVTSWEKIGELAGQGYSDAPVEYDFRDSNLPIAGGNIFYRLKQVDFEGNSAYSETRAIKVEPLPGITYWRVFPNPTTGSPFNIEIMDPSAYRDEPISLRVIAPTGQYELFQVDQIREMGALVSSYFESKAAGVYTIEIAWGAKGEYHKVILRR